MRDSFVNLSFNTAETPYPGDDTSIFRISIPQKLEIISNTIEVNISAEF